MLKLLDRAMSIAMWPTRFMCMAKIEHAQKKAQRGDPYTSVCTIIVKMMRGFAKLIHFAGLSRAQNKTWRAIN